MSVGVFVCLRVYVLAPVAACAAGVAVDHDVLCWAVPKVFISLRYRAI